MLPISIFKTAIQFELIKKKKMLIQFKWIQIKKIDFHSMWFGV